MTAYCSEFTFFSYAHVKNSSWTKSVNFPHHAHLRPPHTRTYCGALSLSLQSNRRGMAGGSVGYSRSSGSRTVVRVVVAGDRGTGKSSLIAAAASESFQENVPSVLPPTRLPADFFPDHVPVTLIDTSSRYLLLSYVFCTFECARARARLALEAEQTERKRSFTYCVLCRGFFSPLNNFVCSFYSPKRESIRG